MDHNASVPLPHHDFPEFGNSSWTPEEEAKIQRLLEENVGMEEAQYRDGPAGSTYNFFDYTVDQESSLKQYETNLTDPLSIQLLLLMLPRSMF